MAKEEREGKQEGEKDLKSKNSAWLWSITALDAVLLLGLQQMHDPAAGSEVVAFATEIGLKSALTAASPVLILLLTHLLPAEAKSVLVYWRVRNVLPSHRAFSVYAKKDHRVDLAALKKNIGKFPESPRDQSARWYQLYQKVIADIRVLSAHRYYLLFRDLAAMSVVLLLAVSIAFCYFEPRLVLPTIGLFGIQYLLSAIAARHNGIGMVTTVLAIHSSHKHP